MCVRIRNFPRVISENVYTRVRIFRFGEKRLLKLFIVAHPLAPNLFETKSHQNRSKIRNNLFFNSHTLFVSRASSDARGISACFRNHSHNVYTICVFIIILLTQRQGDWGILVDDLLRAT